MTREPLVSVVMPVHNGQAFLSQAIESICEQSLRRFEFIILDDGSVDGSREIIDQYDKKDPRIRAISREQKGLVDSLNEGISVARAKYIARMDSDDVSLPNRLELQFEYMEENAHVGILGGQAQVIDSIGRIVGSIRKPRGHTRLQRYLDWGCPIVHPTYMVRTHVYRQLCGYRPLVAVEDLDFLQRAEEAGVVLENLDREVLLYRQSFDGMSARNAYVQVKGTRLAIKVRNRRKRNGREPQKELDVLRCLTGNSNRKWFKAWWKVRESALQLRRTKPGSIVATMIVVGASLMHYELLLASYRSWQAARLTRS